MTDSKNTSQDRVSGAGGSVFDEDSESCRLSLVELRTLLLRIGFVVGRKRESEATLRAYVRARHTYPLLNPRFVRRKIKEIKGTSFLEITVLSKGDDNLEQRLARPHSLPFLVFKPVSEWERPYFVHGQFLVPLTFLDGQQSADADVNALEPALCELLKYLA